MEFVNDIFALLFWPLLTLNNIILAIGNGVGWLFKWIIIICLWFWAIIIIGFIFGSTFEWLVETRETAKERGRLKAVREDEKRIQEEQILKQQEEQVREEERKKIGETERQSRADLYREIEENEHNV